MAENRPAEGQPQTNEGNERLIDRIVSVEPFKPEPPLARVEAPLLPPRERVLLLLAINAVRAGSHHFTVSILYDKQFPEYPPRIADRDYVQVRGVQDDGKPHIGVLVAATIGKTHGLYIRMADVLRADGENIGYTSMSPKGIYSFQILSTFLGPATLGPNGSTAARPPGT